MKTLIFSLALVLVATIGYGQKITELEEAKVGFAPLNVEVNEDGDNFSYTVSESYAGEFQKDPIAFMKANFDIQNFIATHEDRGFDTYHITVSSAQGFLKADYNSKGELLRTFQKFKDIVLPHDVRQELYSSHQGWNMTSNKYVASGRGELLEREVYKVKLENGKQKQNVKLDPKAIAQTRVASND